jgi:hypothetical protein
MEEQQTGNVPSQCPVCEGELLVTRLQCANCGTEVNGNFTLGRLASLREPHASLLEMFLRVRGNVKEMERELGLSYPTVRARLDEAFQAAGFPRESGRGAGDESDWAARFEADLTERIHARVEEALSGLGRSARRAERRAEREAERAQRRAEREAERGARRAEIMDRLERGDISAEEAAQQLRDLKARRYS